MKFEEALKAVRQKKYIKRKDWLDSYAFTIGRQRDWMCSGFLAKSGCYAKHLSNEDILAEDWEIIA